MSKNFLRDLLRVNFRKAHDCNADLYSAHISVKIPSRRLQKQKNGKEIEYGAGQDDLVKVSDFIRQHSVEDLCNTAEEYFKRIDNWDQLLSKPFANSNEVQHLLVQFSHMINGLRLFPGMIILDFGAGSCWASRFLNQMGYSVISLDTSKTALSMGEDLKKKHPVFGKQPDHIFLQFNGREIGLPDESIDRIFCLDAFHHIPNQEEVLREMSRVLKQGGIAAFAEVGPNHSKHPQSQFEMKNFKVLENDIVLKDVYAAARKVGFTNLRVSISGIYPYLVNLDKFENFIDDSALQRQYLLSVDKRMKSYPIFFLDKGETEITDSRNMSGLAAAIETKQKTITAKQYLPFAIEVSFKNISDKTWLPSGDNKGAVNIGAFLYTVNPDGSLSSGKEFRFGLSSSQVLPGETVHTSIDISGLDAGSYRIEIDLVSEYICWFKFINSKTSIIEIKVE